MASEQVVLRIGPDGSIQAETKGIKGPKCLDSIELLEDLLDARATASAFTSDYYETPATTETEVDNELRHR